MSLTAAAPAFAASCTNPKTTAYRVNWASGMANFVRGGYNSTTKQRAATAPATRLSGTGPNPLAVTFASTVIGSTVPSGSNSPAGDFNLTIPRNTTAGTPADTTVNPVVTNLGGLGDGESGLMLYHDTSASGRGNRQEVVISFGGAIVSGLSFWITDIDCLTQGTQYADRVELEPALPDLLANQVKDANIKGTGAFGSPWRRATVNGNGTLANLNGNVGENDTGARVQVKYTSDVSSVKLTYWNELGGSQYHRIFISDLTFNVIAC